jgi:hypothetical protein
MMNWIFYNTLEQAEFNQKIIFEARKLEFCDVLNNEILATQITNRYALPQQRLDGLWGFEKPVKWVDNIDEPVVDEPYNSDWFAIVEDV